MIKSNIVNLSNFELIFWDFDGVIKDSVDIKRQAFISLFDNLDEEIRKRISSHHIKFSGISRYEKIPLYLEWTGITANKNNIKIYLDKFSKKIINEVVDSDWVPGAIKALNQKKSSQKYILLTATPQEEINIILERLKIKKVFNKIFGSPNKKSDIVAATCSNEKILKKNILLIGDSLTDFNAAKENNINFLLREHKLNSYLNKLSVNSIKDFYV